MGMRRDVWPRPVRCSLRSTFSLGARRIAVAAAAASARYSLVTADEPYMTRRRMARRAVSHETGSMGYDTWDTREMRAP